MKPTASAVPAASLHHLLSPGDVSVRAIDGEVDLKKKNYFVVVHFVVVYFGVVHDSGVVDVF